MQGRRQLVEIGGPKLAHTNTINGKIRFKKSAASMGEILMQGARDEGAGNWITISSPEELLKLGIEVNFKKLNDQ